MFKVRPEHIRRVSFTTKLFPRLRTSTAIDKSKLTANDIHDGTVFCGGKSKNKDLLTFLGFIESAETSFIQLPSFRRSLKKLINIVEQELEAVGAQEVLLPALVPEKLWKKSRRTERQSFDHVFKTRNSDDTNLLLGPTFEESITQLVTDVDQIHEHELPLLLFQSSTKFRRESKKLGLLRTNEFLMNDLYSFDADLDRAVNTYEIISKVYNDIFQRLSLPCVKVESRTGDIGGKYSHEYQLQIPSGEDSIVYCNNCQRTFNEEMLAEAEGFCIRCKGDNQDIHTTSKALELGHTFLLSDIYSKPFNAKYTNLSGKRASFFEMGCYGLGLTRILGAGIDLFSIIPNDQDSNFPQLRWPTGVEPYRLGLVGPAKRSRQYNGGSTEFIVKFVDTILSMRSDIDMLIEDRDKEGIMQRVIRLKSLGIPNIITIGQKFLQDVPEFELLQLDDKKKDYVQHWMSEEQLYDFVSKLDR